MSSNSINGFFKKVTGIVDVKEAKEMVKDDINWNQIVPHYHTMQNGERITMKNIPML